MKILLVTSRVTYVPGNYQALIETLVKNHPRSLAGLVILQNGSLSLLKSILGLAFLNCRKVAATLIRNLVFSPLHRRESVFKKNHIPVIYAKTMNSPAMVDWVSMNSIDLIVNLRTRCIYKREILNAPRLGCINVHHGLLPEYRGTLCDLYALYEGRPAGFTIHKMSEKIDAGEIIIRQEVTQTREKNYLRYLERAAAVEADTLSALFSLLEKTGTLKEGHSNYCEKPVFTRNPTRQMIRKMQTQGIQL